MHRTFNLTVPGDGAYHGLYDLMLATTGAIPTDGILPDRGNSLDIAFPDSNVGNPIYISDRNSANNAGKGWLAGDIFHKDSNRNSVCLRDYTLLGLDDDTELIAIVDMEYI